VALDGGIITAEPTEGAYRTDLAEAAVAALTEQGVDVEGLTYEPIEVEVTPGGE
jgi:NitT/TauT family transport system substrate-binding protein